MRTPAQNAQLALLLEVAGTPKPGNVDRHREMEDLWFEHFLAGAVGAQRGLEQAERGGPIGDAFERAVEGMAGQAGGNTQFGALLLLVPLVSATRSDLTPAIVEDVVADTTTADAAGFYRAFDHVDVFVDEPPDGMDELDVRRGTDAVPALEARGLSLQAILERAASHDDVAREWTCGFERSFSAAERLSASAGPAVDRAATVFLSLLAERPDTLVASRRGQDVAREVTARARALNERAAVDTDREAVEAFADDLVERGINPGTTADLTAAGLFIALETGGLEI